MLESMKIVFWSSALIIVYAYVGYATVRSQDAMDRFVRYEAHLSREFDRVLNQLERGTQRH